MKLVFRSAEQLTFQMTSDERSVLQALFEARGLFPRKSQPLSRELSDPQTAVAQADLDEALRDHRRTQMDALKRLLQDQQKWVPKDESFLLNLSPTESEGLLQVLNEIRVGAWEKLGCPNFEAGERPKVTSENQVCFWAMGLTDWFQGTILNALTDENDSGATG